MMTCLQACSKKFPLVPKVLPSWLKACSEAGEKVQPTIAGSICDQPASSAVRHACFCRLVEQALLQVAYKGQEVKIFTGVTASISGALAKEKAKYADLIKAYGGAYSPELTKQCTHLVIMKRKGTTRELSAKEM